MYSNAFPLQIIILVEGLTWILFISSLTSEDIPFSASLSEKTTTLQWDKLTSFPIYALSKLIALFIEVAVTVSIIALFESPDCWLENAEVSINSKVTCKFCSPSFTSTARAIT